MSSLQVLVATMGQKDFSKVTEMNIQSDAILANQADTVSYKEQSCPFGKISMITTNTKGVGKNRNLGLMYSAADILLLSDDDVVLVDGYANIVLSAFAANPKADAVIFNVKARSGKASGRQNTKVKRIRWYECLNYGAVRIAVRRTAVKRENITFNENFGGGTLFSSGEDSLFIADMMKRKLKLYTSPETIAVVDDLRKSSWFRGYGEKYYYDKGVFFRTLSRHFAWILCVQDLLRHPRYKHADLTFQEAYRQMMKGLKGYWFLKEF